MPVLKMKLLRYFNSAQLPENPKRMGMYIPSHPTGYLAVWYLGARRICFSPQLSHKAFDVQQTQELCADTTELARALR